MSKTRMFIGKVETVEDNHVITFSIDNFADNLSPYPKAVAMTKLTRFPQVDDEVFIIQPDSDFEIFLYTLTSDDTFDISLNYDESYVSIKKENDKYEISLKTSDTISLRQGDNSFIIDGGVMSMKSNDNLTLTSEKSVKMVCKNNSVEVTKDKIESNLNGKVITATSSKVNVFNQVEVTA